MREIPVMPRKFWIYTALHAIATLLLTICFFGALFIIAEVVGSYWFGY